MTAPGVFTLEHLLEVIQTPKILHPIFFPLDEDPTIHHGEDHLPEIIGGVDPPMLQHGSGHEAIPGEGQVPDPVGLLLPGDVSRLPLSLQNGMEGGKEEDIGFPMEPGVSSPQMLEDLLGEYHVRHGSKVTVFEKGR